MFFGGLDVFCFFFWFFFSNIHNRGLGVRLSVERKGQDSIVQTIVNIEQHSKYQSFGGTVRNASSTIQVFQLPSYWYF